MALSRSLTKKLQKLNDKVARSRSSSTAALQSAFQPISTTTPTSEKEDEFISINFDSIPAADAPTPHFTSGSDIETSSIGDAESLSSSFHPTPTTGITADDYFTVGPQSRARSATVNSSTGFPSTPSTAVSANSVVPTPTTDCSSMPPSPVQQFCHSGSAYTKHASSGASAPLAPSVTDPLSSSTQSIASTTHKSYPSISSSCYSGQSPVDLTIATASLRRPVDEDAEADEMAMNILKKVSADDYVQELRAGSWYI